VASTREFCAARNYTSTNSLVSLAMIFRMRVLPITANDDMPTGGSEREALQFPANREIRFAIQQR